MQRPLSGIELYGPAGDSIRLGVVETGSDDRELRVAVLSALTAGPHEVRWRTAGPDSHPISGSFRFEVPGPREASEPTANDTPRVASVEPTAPVADHADDSGLREALALPGLPLRWLHFLTIAFMVGLAGFQRFVAVPAATRGEAAAPLLTAGLRRWGIVVGGLALVLAFARLEVQRSAMFGPDSASGYSALLTASPWGWAWTAHVAGAGLFLLALLLSGSDAPSRLWVLAGAGALMAAVSRIAAGHAWAVDGPLRPLALISDGVHMVSAGLWVGGLGALALIALPTLRNASGDPGGEVREWIAGFSRMALLGVVLLFLSGAAHAAVQLGSLSELFGSVYGRTLIAKLLVLVGPAALGFYHWRVVRPRLESNASADHLSRTVGVELALAVAVVFVAAILVVVHLPG